MSDGPHRSLPMRKAWKDLAKCAEQPTYAPEQVCEAALRALSGDWKKEISAKLIVLLKKVFLGHDNSLGFQKIALDQLGAAKSLAAGSVMGTNLVGWCIELVQGGRMNLQAFYDAVRFTIQERAFAGARQVEEHYLRKADLEQSIGVKARIEEAISGLSEKMLGEDLVDSQPPSGRTVRKRKDIDDGVPLR